MFKKKKVTFKITVSKIKYLGINLIKEVEDSYTENCKTLIKETEGVCSLSCVQLFATLWTVVCQTSPSMGFSRQEYWSGLPSPSPGDLPNPGIEPTLQADALPSKPPWKPLIK